MKKRVVVAGMVSMGLLTVCIGCTAEEIASVAFQNYSCNDLSRDAAGLGPNILGISLVTAYDLNILSDNRNNPSIPNGAHKTTILKCMGVGAFSTNEEYPVILEASLDVNGDIYISWELGN